MKDILIDILNKKKGKLFLPFLILGIIGCMIDYSTHIFSFDLLGIRGIVHATLASWTSPWNIIIFGICGIQLSCINQFPKYFNMTMLNQTILGTIVIEVNELVSGLILNCVFHLHIWDYSGDFMNLWGQIELKNGILFFIGVPFFIWVIDTVNWALYRKLSDKEWFYHVWDNYVELWNDVKHVFLRAKPA